MSTVSDKITEHMGVVGSDGVHVGTVDHVQDDQIKLTRNDSDSGQHHLIPTSLVASVDTQVHLSKSASEVKQAWTSA